MNDKLREAIPILALFGLGWWYLKRQKGRISYGAVSTRIHSINFNGLKLVVTLPVINGSSYTATVQSFIGQLYKGTSPIGVITMPKAVEVTANTQSFVSFDVNIGLLNGLLSVAPDIYAVVQAPPSNVQDALKLINLKSLRIIGVLRVDGIAVDIDQTLA